MVRYLVTVPRLVYRYDYQESADEIVTDTDSDWAGDKTTRRSQMATHETFGEHIIDHVSVRQASVALSSGEAEYGGIVRGTAGAIETREMLKEAGIDVKIKVRTDSSAARGICHRRGVGRVRHLDVKELWVQEKVQRGELQVDKVDTELNRADIGTKPMEGPKLKRALSLLSVSPQSSWRETGLVSMLLATQGDAAAVGMQEVAKTATLNWLVESSLNHLQKLVGTTLQIRVWVLMMLLLASFAAGCGLVFIMNKKDRVEVKNVRSQTIEQEEQSVTDAGSTVTRNPGAQHESSRMGTPGRNESRPVQRAVGIRPTFREEQYAFYNAWTVYTLREDLRRRGLRVSGIKHDLIERILNHTLG